LLLSENDQRPVRLAAWEAAGERAARRAAERRRFMVARVDGI
jgi:hypothetical protein